MHRIYVTEGVVLNKRGTGEANTSVTIMTRELGLVRTTARSARKEASKLRYGLEPLTTGRFSFVQGRYEWKLVGVESPLRVLSRLLASTVRLGRISRLVLRLVQGEEPVPVLYDELVQGFGHISHATHDSMAESLECVLVLRILSHLGYLPQTQELEPFVEGDLVSSALVQEAGRSRAFLIRTINQSLEATGL